jgi:hypothetical protein
MPRAELHISQAERNEKFCKSQKLCGSKYKEWGVIVLFYAALHYVDAILAQDPNLTRQQQHPGDHKKRKKSISKCSKLNPIASKYLTLQQRSEDARYRCYDIPKELALKLEADFYSPIQDYIRKQLGLT